MSDPPDYATWPTKAQAAAALGVTPKTVERFVQAGQIQQARWRRQGRGPALAVYHPDDVARLAAERRLGPLPAFVVPAPAVAGNGNGRGAKFPAVSDRQRVAPQPADALAAGLQAFVAALRAVSETSETLAQTSATPRYVDRATALRITGVSAAELRKAVQAGEIHRRGRAYSRKDCEALS